MTNELFEFEILKASRTRLLQLIETVDNKILFKIPENFNNNIVWQIGHCITSQQRHMYMRSGLPMHISQYTPFSLPIGITITNHLQALQAANFHEAEHYGIILSYLKLLN